MCLNAPMIAEPLGLFDCCGVSDGAACAIVTTPEIARALGKTGHRHGQGAAALGLERLESQHNAWDGSYFHTTRIAAKQAYEEAGIKNPRDDSLDDRGARLLLDHRAGDHGRPAHLRGQAKGWKDVLDGFYDADGAIPCQIDGGLKCFGHPIGASGLRMLYEMYLQLQGRAGARQLKNPAIGLTHNLGGAPSMNVCSVAIIGAEGA